MDLALVAPQHYLGCSSHNWPGLCTLDPKPETPEAVATTCKTSAQCKIGLLIIFYCPDTGVQDDINVMKYHEISLSHLL